jgi:hypothetical protein
MTFIFRVHELSSFQNHQLQLDCFNPHFPLCTTSVWFISSTLNKAGNEGNNLPGYSVSPPWISRVRENTASNLAQKCASVFRLKSLQFYIFKMVAMCSSETLVPVYQTTHYQNLWDHNINLYLKSYKLQQRKVMEGTTFRKQRGK